MGHAPRPIPAATVLSWTQRLVAPHLNTTGSTARPRDWALGTGLETGTPLTNDPETTSPHVGTAACQQQAPPGHRAEGGRAGEAGRRDPAALEAEALCADLGGSPLLLGGLRQGAALRGPGPAGVHRAGRGAPLLHAGGRRRAGEGLPLRRGQRVARPDHPGTGGLPEQQGRGGAEGPQAGGSGRPREETEELGRLRLRLHPDTSPQPSNIQFLCQRLRPSYLSTSCSCTPLLL
ncbi:hypothetical protein NDU88_010174 [Pleurodeles waltl]|uniref:Uncharacterized protein n=1 Tax=Pleurodeles waltl TaxID=8319 RepID=A0AAV7PX49_PLEWA|nr:hypothetical protein NDU88_010174 [Pleurodeles waltl]